MAEETFEKRQLPKKSDDLSSWYNRVVLQAELADYGPAKGTMIFRPYGFAIWEFIRESMNKKIKERGVENSYFPLFIPESLLKKEKDHVEGFSPELAVVTIAGGEKLSEPLIVRPTSETVMYEAFARWVHSWRDLPMMLNQWNNVVRWEKRTYLFLRTSEFLWQEGHTVHASHEESLDMVRWAIDMYDLIYKEVLAIPGYVGRKSESEKFAGADMTLTHESLMPEGKALQGGTSHDLGQNFSKVFNISFQDKDREQQFGWQTSWGLSTRSIGGLIMTHGDDQGLRLPPELAPIQVVVLPIRLDKELLQFSRELAKELEEIGVRVKIDEKDDRIGYKHNEWELKGVPIRIEVGPKELEDKKLTLIRRDVNDRLTIDFSETTQKIPDVLKKIQKSLYTEAQNFLEENTRDAASFDEFEQIMKEHKGFIRAFWCEDPKCEAEIKEITKASVRCLPLESKEEDGICVRCGKPARHRWIFAQAY